MKVKFEIPIGFHLVALICLSSVCFEGPKPSYGSDLLFNRSSFPADFLFGTGLSALQSEGAANLEGRTPSIWDTYIKNHPEKIADGSNADIATDFYFRYKDDVALMKKIGMSSFRFSISWSRILPQGKIVGGVNQQGVDFYNSLINELVSNGIEPFVTLVHFDLPQVLEDEYGGFLSPKIVKDYVDYEDFCFKQFGDRVKYWVTLNEPETFAQFGYGDGSLAPGRCSNFRRCAVGNSSTEPYLVAHHEILCHATAAKLYKDNYQTSQNGFIGISINTKWAEPKFQTIASKKAASRYLDFQLGWIFHPITYGNYPKTMQDLVGDRLPKFTKSESEMIKGSADFLGLNYYTASYVEDARIMNITLPANYQRDRHISETNEKNGIPIGEQAGSPFFYMYPKGIQKLLLYVKQKYKSPIIYVTENGVRDQALNDNFRIKFHHQHLLYLLQAIKNGVDVRGYYVWSLLDDFEWLEGYTSRFGIIYIDYKNKLKRCFKKSALWFKNLLQKEDASISSLNLYYDQ